MKQPLFLVLLLAFPLCQARAVKTGGDTNPLDFDGTYHTTAPTDGDISNWTTGWGSGTVTGWNYVGTTGGASADYLGNGWVLTAAHVNGDSIFTLDGVVYSRVVGSEVSTVTTTGGTTGTADLTLFKIATDPNLPSLTLANSISAGSSVVMLGFGGGHGETWGTNTINLGTSLVQVDITASDQRWSNDFTVNHSSTTGANLVLGDSGGGDFTFDSATGQWELAGINEAVDGSGNSYMIDLSKYASQINQITDVPEPGTWLLLGVGAVLVWARRRS